jgi:hypothetical protein
MRNKLILFACFVLAITLILGGVFVERQAAQADNVPSFSVHIIGGEFVALNTTTHVTVSTTPAATLSMRILFTCPTEHTRPQKNYSSAKANSLGRYTWGGFFPGCGPLPGTARVFVTGLLAKQIFVAQKIFTIVSQGMIPISYHGPKPVPTPTSAPITVTPPATPVTVTPTIPVPTATPTAS